MRLLISLVRRKPKPALQVRLTKGIGCNGGRSAIGGAIDYVKFRGGRDALGLVFPFARCDSRGHLQPGYARAERRLRHPDVGPVQGQNPLGLRFLRRFRFARTVEGDRLANERLEGGLVNFFSFVDVNRAACVSVETRVEETGRILQRRALGKGKLHDILVGFASADDAVVRPNRSAHPLPLLDDVRVCFLDELAHSAEGFPAPVPEFGDSFRDELRCRLAMARARLVHHLVHPFQQRFEAIKPFPPEGTIEAHPVDQGC
jgi:hypothetical protein